MTDEYDDYDFDEDEVTALWDGRLPMDRVLQTLQSEIERHKQTQAQLAAALARAEAAEEERDTALSRLHTEQAIIDGDIPNAWGLAALRRIGNLESELAALRAQLAAEDAARKGRES